MENLQRKYKINRTLILMSKYGGSFEIRNYDVQHLKDEKAWSVIGIFKLFISEREEAEFFSAVWEWAWRHTHAIDKNFGDLKESPSLGESSHVMFSRMAKYSSLTAFYTFSEQQPKAIEDKVCLHQSWSLCTEGWKVEKYVLFLEYLKLNVNCSCVRKENTKQKEIIHLVDPRTLQNKAAETIFWILESKNVSIASIGNSVFDEIDNVKS